MKLVFAALLVAGLIALNIPMRAAFLVSSGFFVSHLEHLQKKQEDNVKLRSQLGLYYVESAGIGSQGAVFFETGEGRDTPFGLDPIIYGFVYYPYDVEVLDWRERKWVFGRWYWFSENDGWYWQY